MCGHPASVERSFFFGIVLLPLGLLLHGCDAEEKAPDTGPATEHASAGEERLPSDTPPPLYDARELAGESPHGTGPRGLARLRPPAESAAEIAERLAALAYEEAVRADTPEGYERFLQDHPDSPYERTAAERLEALCFDRAREAGTPEAYKRFIYRFPLSGRSREIFTEAQRACSLRSHDVAWVTHCRELLTLLPYSPRKAELLDWIQGVEEALKSDRVGYERYLAAPTEYASVYQRFPLHGAESGASPVSDLSVEEIWRKAQATHRRHRIHHPAANPHLERLHLFFLTYDLASRLRFHRGVDAFPGHHDFPEIGAHIVEQRWFEEFLAKVTADPAYNYKEGYPLRVILAIHTAAHFFQLPFPTLFCLIFQESKFDFSVASAAGAVGLGQLTPIGVRQIEKLRARGDYEARLQGATAHLGAVYRDEVIRAILDRMGIEHAFPALPDRFPDTVGQTFPGAVDAAFVQEVSRILQERGLGYGSDLARVRANCRLLARGMMLPDRLAPLHAAYHEVMEQRFGGRLGNVYNPETNILYSAALLRYYMRYRWYVSGQELELRPLVRSMAAVVSYNQGQTGVRRYLEQVRREFPDLDLNEATLVHLRALFTKDRLAVHHPGRPGTVREVYRHATAIGTCSCRLPEENG